MNHQNKPITCCSAASRTKVDLGSSGTRLGNTGAVIRLGDTGAAIGYTKK